MNKITLQQVCQNMFGHTVANADPLWSNSVHNFLVLVHLGFCSDNDQKSSDAYW